MNWADFVVGFVLGSLIGYVVWVGVWTCFIERPPGGDR